MTIEIVLLGKTSDPAAFAELANDMCAAAQQEEGTLRYEWHLAPDGKTRNLDVYSDGDNFLSHFAAAQEAGLIDRYLGTIELERVDVTGEVSQEARSALEGFGATFYDHVASTT